MPEVEAIKALFDVGGVVVVTFMLWIVWRRLNDTTDRLIDILSELKAQSIKTERFRADQAKSNLKP